MKYMITISLMVLLAVSVSFAGGKKKYMIIAPHTVEKCMTAIDEVAGYETLLKNTEWGCMDGDHTSYSTVMAEDKEAARKMLPEELRKDAKIIMVVNLNKKKIEDLHKKMSKKK